MKTKTPLFLALPLVATAFTSCLSGYRAIDPGNHQQKHAEKKLADGDPFEAIILDAPLKGDTGSFYITLVVPHETGATPLKLSHLRITPTAVSESSAEYRLQRIEFSLMPPSGFRTHLKTIAGSQVGEPADFDLNESVYYNITYIFSDNPRRRLKHITVRIDADLSGAMDQKDFHRTVVFRRYSGLQIYH